MTRDEIMDEDRRLREAREEERRRGRGIKALLDYHEFVMNLADRIVFRE